MIFVSQENGIVYLWDLPEDKVFIKLQSRIQKEMIEKALQIAITRNNLAKELKVNPETIYDFREARFESVKFMFVKRLCKFLVKNGFKKFSLENLEDKIELVRTKTSRNPIHNPKFPMNFNCKEGAQIIAGILFDGGITTGFRPFYTNDDESLVSQFANNLRKVTGEINFYKRLCKNTHAVEFSTILGHILVNGLDLAPGKKVFTDPQIPEFILKSGIEIQKVFLQQAFDDEGTINLGSNANSSGRAINLTQHNRINKPPLRLLQLREIIEKFEISVNKPCLNSIWFTKKGFPSYDWGIQISNRSDIRTFVTKINFTLECKKEKLKELLNSYRFCDEHFKKGKKFEEILKACKILKSKNQKITSKNIAQLLGRGHSYICFLTKKMIERDLLKIVKQQTWNGKSSTCKEFEVEREVI